MNDPYAVLGLSPSASDEEVKRAYRALVKKYHPDNYVNNPLADLAEAKMKEINEAYDAIVKGRTQGGYQQQAQSNGNRYGTGGQAGQNPAFLQVRQLIVQNNLAEAERILRSTAANSAEWYFLMGSIAYKRGWMDDARQNYLLTRMTGKQVFVTACDSAAFGRAEGRVYRLENGAVTQA